MPGKAFQNDVGMYTYSPGLGHVPAYQVSGIPFVTGGITVSSTPLQISFPYVTSWFYITHHSVNDLRVGFSANGVNGTNYFIVPGTTQTAGQNNYSMTVVLPVKCSSIYLKRDNSSDVTTVSVIAGLTAISTNELVNSGPNGNNWSGSSGVG